MQFPNNLVREAQIQRQLHNAGCSAVGQVPAAGSCRGEQPAHIYLLATVAIIPSSISAAVAAGERAIYCELKRRDKAGVGVG